MLYNINYFNKSHNINYSGTDLLNILLIMSAGVTEAQFEKGGKAPEKKSKAAKKKQAAK